jgi:hypothetical protein
MRERTSPASINSPRRGGSVPFRYLRIDLGRVLSQPGFLFVKHGNSPLHKFVDGLVGAALNVLLNQLFNLGSKTNILLANI